jgi:hypothetical protein
MIDDIRGIRADLCDPLAFDRPAKISERQTRVHRAKGRVFHKTDAMNVYPTLTEKNDGIRIAKIEE